MAHQKERVLITVGDANGIGPEVAAKARMLLSRAEPMVAMLSVLVWK